MSTVAICPECGAPRSNDRNAHARICSESSRNVLDFFRVLNGTHWREKPNAPPRDRDDIVPND